MRTRTRASAPAQREGFTIIEVLIVLAIAGLILMMVFLLVSKVKQNARNHDRKHSATLVSSQLNEYQNNFGTFPFASDAEAQSFIDNYLDAITKRYDVQYHDRHGSHAHIPAMDEIVFQMGHWCNKYGNGDAASDPIAGNDVNIIKYVVWTQLEPVDASSPQIFCIDNYGR